MESTQLDLHLWWFHQYLSIAHKFMLIYIPRFGNCRLCFSMIFLWFAHQMKLRFVYKAWKPTDALCRVCIKMLSSKKVFFMFGLVSFYTLHTHININSDYKFNIHGMFENLAIKLLNYCYNLKFYRLFASV